VVSLSEETIYISISKTATADTSFRLSDAPIEVIDGNFHCSDNDAYYGDGQTMNADLITGDILPFEKGRLDTLWFKNKVAGNNCIITFVGSVLKRTTDRGY